MAKILKLPLSDNNSNNYDNKTFHNNCNYYEKNYLHTNESLMNITLEEAYNLYISSKSAILSPSTIYNYEKYKRNYFQDIMNMPLYQINNYIIQNSVNEFCKDYSPKTVRNAFGLLHAVLFNYYPELNLTITLPQKIKPVYTIPVTSEIKTLIRFADERIKLPILLASQGGLRRSEISALKITDFTNKGVYINKAVVSDGNRNYIVKSTKTLAGTRFVPLTQSVIAEAKDYEYFGISPAQISKAYRKLFVKVDLEHYFSFHKLRHYFASQLHAKGLKDKYIAEIGGWSSVAIMQNIYEHTLRDELSRAEKEITEIFDEIFNWNQKNDLLLQLFIIYKLYGYD